MEQSLKAQVNGLRASRFSDAVLVAVAEKALRIVLKKENDSTRRAVKEKNSADPSLVYP